jgi:hypothetical protein
MITAGLANHVRSTGAMPVSRHRLGILSGEIARCVADSATSTPSTRISTAVRASIEAFVSCRGQVDVAAAQVAPLLQDLGAREARHHSDPARLDRSFRLATVAVQRGLSHVMDDGVSSQALRPMREALMAYMAHLHRAARAGFDHATQLMAMTDVERFQALRAIVFRGAPPRDLDEICTMMGLDPAQRYVPIAAVDASLPPAVRDHPEAIVDSASSEALVPETWSHDTLERHLLGQAVVGPPTTVAEAYESITLTRNAAALLRDGSARDTRAIVPATDLLGELLVRGNRLIADLLIDKHLQPLHNVSTNRRLILAETLLLVLERGLPLNQIARELDTAAQTVHNRMRALRALLGAKLDDPTQRLELIVALRAGLDRWRARPL